MNNKQKAFLILTPGFAASETDTNCLPMQQSFVRSLSKLYPEIDIIVLSFHYPFFERTYKWFDAKVISFNGRNKGGLSGMFLRRSVNRSLKRIHKTRQIVGMLSFWLGECALVGKKFAEKNNILHYCWLMGQDSRTNNKYPQKLSVRSEELIALSDFLQEEFERNYNVKPFTVIPPGIEGYEFKQSPRDIDLLAVGSLIPLKQFEIFVETVAVVKEHEKNIKAILAGDGPEKNKIEKLIADYNLENNITLTGKIEHDEVLAMMQRSKVLLHPSSYEGFSGVCQEALANGAYVISFCKAMNYEIPGWHIANSKTDMINKVISIIKNQSARYEPVKFQSMNEVTKRVMDLF